MERGAHAEALRYTVARQADPLAHTWYERRPVFRRVFRTYPFTVLEEDEGLFISGLCGRIWTLARDYPDLAGPEAFRDSD